MLNFVSVADNLWTCFESSVELVYLWWCMLVLWLEYRVLNSFSVMPTYFVVDVSVVTVASYTIAISLLMPDDLHFPFSG